MNAPTEQQQTIPSEERPPAAEQAGEGGAVVAAAKVVNGQDGEQTSSVEQKKTDNSQSEIPAENGDSPAKKGAKKRVTSGKKIIGLLLPDSHMVYRVAANFPDLAANDLLLLQTRTGEVVGKVSFVSCSPPEKNIDSNRLFPGKITRIIRKLSQQDIEAMDKKADMEKQAKVVCRQAIRDLKLPMKLAKVTYLQKGSKILFHFTSEGRVDFRELVRKLGADLKTRIEMRHIGVRDETRLLGGVGPCGKDLCCSQYLQKFHPVSVRMAKNQDLSLNPDGISGVCGRLLCCLAYENDAYAELKKGLPKVKKCCWTQGGKEATVKCVHTLSGMVTVQHLDGTYATLPAATLSKTKPEPGQSGEEQEELTAPLAPQTKTASSSTPTKNNSPGSGRTDNRAAPEGEEDKAATDGAAIKAERKKRGRRRRKGGRSREPGATDAQQANAQALQGQAPVEKANRKSKQDGSPTAEKIAESGKGGPQDAAADKNSSGGGPDKKRRRRRRRRGGNSGAAGGDKKAKPTSSSE